MGGVARAIVSPISIIDKGISKAALQVIAVVGPFLGPPGQAAAAVAAIALATLYKPKGPKPEQQERAIKMALPPRVSAYGRVRLYGAYSLFTTSEAGRAVDVWAFHDGKIDGIERHYLLDKQVTLVGGFVQEDADGAYGSDVIQIGTRLGLSTETAFDEVIAQLPGIWTEDHRGDGIATGCMVTRPVKAKNFSKIFPSGGPDQTPLSLVLRAQPVFDWRDPAQDVNDTDTWVWSENNALHIAHYYLVRYGKDWDTHFAPTLDYWTAFADDCDVAMPLKAGGTEPRYRSCVAHKHTDPHKVTLGNLLACSDGFVAPRGDGALMAYSGRYVEPDPADMIGPDEIVSFSWDEGVVDEDAVNEIAISYISADHDYTVVDATAWRDEAAISAAGEVKPTTLENSVPSHAQARRLTKRLIAKTMAPHRGMITTNRKGRKIRGKRFIPVHIEEAGAVFYSGPAEITQLRRLSTGGVAFSWIAADPNIDEWNPATEEGDPAPVGTQPSPTPLAAPVIDDATATLAEDSGDGTAGVRIVLDIAAPDRDDLTWFVHWRVQGAAVWGADAIYSDAAPGAAVQIVTGFVAVNALVEVEAAYQIGDGRLSPWSLTETVDTSTAGLAPSPPTEVSADGGVGEADITWRNPSSSNLSYLKVFRNTTATFGTATDISGEIVGGLGEVMSITDTGLTAGTKYYWVVAYNAADIASAPAGPDSAVVT